jgi:predicted NBD/HSP70 family sugar kinase
MYAAIDIGGTKTLVAVYDLKGNLKEDIKFPTPKNYDIFLIELEKTVSQLSTTEFNNAVVAVPARLDRKNGIALAFGNLEWENISIGPDIEKILHCPVTIENDAKLAALSEAILVLPDYRKALYVTISTGIGAGLVVDGTLEPNLLDLEAGQMLLEYNGKLRDWEDFGSGRAFQQKFGVRVGEMDENNGAAWYWLARNIAIGLIDLMATLTPDIVIIGGGAGAHLAKFSDRLDEQLKIYENPMFAIPPVVGAQNAEKAVVYGCYELAKQFHQKRS